MQQVTNIQQLETAINQNGEMVISKDNNNIIIMNMEEYRNKALEKDIEKHLLKAEDDIERESKSLSELRNYISNRREWSY